MINQTAGYAEVSAIAALLALMFGSTLAMLWAIDLLKSFFHHDSETIHFEGHDDI